MTLLSSALGALGTAWTNLALRFALPPAPPGDDTGAASDRLDAEERDLRILMSHWF